MPDFMDVLDEFLARENPSYADVCKTFAAVLGGIVADPTLDDAAAQAVARVVSGAMLAALEDRTGAAAGGLQ